MKNLFVYGTLTFPEIMHALVGKNFRCAPASLKNHSVVTIDGKAYPALIKSFGKTANGLVLFDVDKESFRIIQAWEGNEYDLRKVEVIIHGTSMMTEIFCWKSPISKPAPWDRKTFEKDHLHNYILEKIPVDLASKTLRV
ncbi:MAG: gamma-glutamylcyclotransferase family protein [Candidatus Saccharimonadales bacterium]